ncbi:MAG: hypothetical protein ACK50Y_04100 [Flavobacteriia bacterium]|jgi:hypothetical protein
MKYLFTLSSALILLIIACGKNKYDNSSAPKLNAMVENYFSEFSNMTDQAITGNMVFYKVGEVISTNIADGKPIEFIKTDCNVLITIDTAGTNKTITIDWGTSNCTCNDGKSRRGKLVSTFTGSYFAQGTVITHTPVDYYVNDNKVEGTKTVTNMGLNSSGQIYYNVEVDGIVTMSTGEVINYTSSRVRTFTNGHTTPNIFLDDEYAITLTSNATVSNGDSYEAHTTEALKVKVGCGYIKSGVLSITPSGKPERVIDYGDGTCDATFTITINGNTYVIN